MGIFGALLTFLRGFFLDRAALAAENLAAWLSAFIAAGKPTLITDGLAERIGDKVKLDLPNVRILAIRGKPKSLLELPRKEIDAMRAMMLRPLQLSLKAPNRVGFYPFQDGSWVVENFNSEPVAVELNGRQMTVEPRAWKMEWK